MSQRPKETMAFRSVAGSVTSATACSGTERTGRLLQSDGIATDQRDRGSIGEKAARDGQPDPLGPAGDHGIEPVQRL